ncbi:juvenile hormone esterase-like isoform X2 [Lycorma delicatula]
MYVIYYIMFSIYVFTFCESSVTPDCFVHLDYGRLSGEKRTTDLLNITFCSYKGIPYAKPPVGNLRFKDPDPTPNPWDGIRDASKEGKACIQNDKMFGKDGFDVTDEDCLFLNVYSPFKTRNTIHHHEPMTVMVWIHGGGFLFGNGNEELYGPDFIIENDVILVTINYRLGVFGFLNLGISEAPGNAGLKDQVAALSWVQKYIHLFGGNPQKVTIFGESAGASSVHYHMLSPMSNGLFHQAILQSGSALTTWAFNNDVKNEAFELGRLLNCNVSSNSYADAQLLVNCLREKTAGQLKEFQCKVICAEEYRKGMFLTFLPSIEVTDTVNKNFLTETPLQLLKKGSFAKVPTLIGFNNREGLMFLTLLMINNEWFDKINNDFNQLVPPSLGLQENSLQFQQVKDKMKKFYFNNEPLSWDLIEPLCDLISDFAVVIPVYRTIIMMTESSNKSIYTYEFAVDGNRGPMKPAVIKWNSRLNITGASHFDEIGYLFNFHMYGPMPVQKDTVELNTIKRLTSFWTNFAKTG